MPEYRLGLFGIFKRGHSNKYPEEAIKFKHLFWILKGKKESNTKRQYKQISKEYFKKK